VRSVCSSLEVSTRSRFCTSAKGVSNILASAKDQKQISKLLSTYVQSSMDRQDVREHLCEVHKKLFSQQISFSGHQKYIVVMVFSVTCVIRS